MGVDPKDIDYFTLSHSHLDHSGNANLFKSSTWIVDEAERDFMFREERSEEHTSELQSLMRISYAVFCLKKKNYTHIKQQTNYRQQTTTQTTQDTEKQIYPNTH